MTARGSSLPSLHPVTPPTSPNTTPGSCSLWLCLSCSKAFSVARSHPKLPFAALWDVCLEAQPCRSSRCITAHGGGAPSTPNPPPPAPLGSASSHGCAGVERGRQMLLPLLLPRACGGGARWGWSQVGWSPGGSHLHALSLGFVSCTWSTRSPLLRGWWRKVLVVGEGR